MTGFEAGERGWINRFSKLRNLVRQELIARRLATSLGQPGSVLDVGCGQGEQARRLLAAGWTVTGVDPSEVLLQSFRSACSGDATTVELIAGDIEELNSLLGRRSFDLVCAHGLLMYLDDRGWAVQTLARRVAPGGVLSLTFRNAHALAMRPGVRQDWRGALEAFDSSSYVNELGLDARACGASVRPSYNSRVRRVLGPLILLAGIWIMIFPFSSVWSATTQALEVLPDPEGAESDDDRNWTAMFSPGFVLATRSYEGVQPSQYADSLVRAGFATTIRGNEQWWTTPCCGDFDAAEVKLDEAGSERTLVTVSVFDNDVQAAWPFLSAFGLLIVLVGYVVCRGDTGQRRPNQDETLPVAAE